MSDKKRNHEKKEKNVEMEELNKVKMDEEYMEMPSHDMQNQGPQHNCPMMYQCPMVHQCPMMPQANLYMPSMQGEDLRIKDWFEEWDESSEDSSFEFDSDAFYSPEKYYEKHHNHHQHPYFWPPYFPNYRK